MMSSRINPFLAQVLSLERKCVVKRKSVLGFDCPLFLLFCQYSRFHLPSVRMQEEAGFQKRMDLLRDLKIFLQVIVKYL